MQTQPNLSQNVAPHGAYTTMTLPTHPLEEDFLEYALSHRFGDLHFKVDPQTGMKAIIAIHSTKLGPALGGCRFIPYPDTTTALYDAMRLARGMSYKSALMNLPLGGGKSVIIQPQEAYDRSAYFHAFGKFVDELGGRYITALDSGTLLSDMDVIAEHTPYVASLSTYSGDPSPSTALGVLLGIKAAVSYKLGKEDLQGLHIAIQGLGHVGYHLARHLHELKVQLTVSDIDPSRVSNAVKEFGAAFVPSEEIHKVPCDVFSPCALGGILNDATIPELQTSIVAGSANNQLGHTYHGEILNERGILYAPDYVINAGGLIFAAGKYLQTKDSVVMNQIHEIQNILLEIFKRSIKENRPASDVADAIAQERLAE